MRKSPITLAALAGILIIVLFILVSAVGFGGILPGSRLYRNKEDQGYYIFFRFLEERNIPIVFEKSYSLPLEGLNTLVYIDGEEGFYSLDLEQWVRNGNTLFLIGPAAETANNKTKGQSLFTDQTEKGKIRLVKKGKGQLIIIEDGTFFSNGSLKELAKADVLDRLFNEYSRGTVYLRERKSMAQFNPSFLGELFSGRIFLLSIQLILIFLLLVIKRTVRFARPERLTGKKNRRISEHIKGVGLFYGRAGAHEIVEKVNSEYFKTIICRNRIPDHLKDENYLSLIKSKDINRKESMKRFWKREDQIDKMKREREKENE